MVLVGVSWLAVWQLAVVNGWWLERSMLVGGAGGGGLDSMYLRTCVVVREGGVRGLAKFQPTKCTEYLKLSHAPLRSTWFLFLGDLR